MEDISNIPGTLPILASGSMFVYPTAAAIMQVDHESAFRLLDDVKESQHRLLVVAAQKSPDRMPSGVSDLFRVGTIARLVQMRDSLEGKREIVVLGLERGVIGESIQEQPYILANIAPKLDLEEQEEISPDEVSKITSSFRELMARSQKMLPHEVDPHFEHKTLREIVYTMAFFSGIDFQHGRQLLELDSVPARLVV